MLDPTLQSAIILRSVRKFFIDTFKTGLDIPLYFEFIDKKPTGYAKWMCVVERGGILDTLAEKDFQVYLFSTSDVDGVAVSEFRDLVFEGLSDVSQNDAKRRLICYDATWIEQFRSVLTIQDDIVFDPYDEGINLRVLPFRLNWGQK